MPFKIERIEYQPNMADGKYVFLYAVHFRFENLRLFVVGYMFSIHMAKISWT